MKNVQFTGFVPAEELPDYFRLADVFVMPSTGEGFGIVFLQAIATGLPRDRRKPRRQPGRLCAMAHLGLWSILRIARSSHLRSWRRSTIRPIRATDDPLQARPLWEHLNALHQSFPFKMAGRSSALSSPQRGSGFSSL